MAAGYKCKLEVDNCKLHRTSELALADRIVPSSVGDRARFCGHRHHAWRCVLVET